MRFNIAARENFKMFRDDLFVDQGKTYTFDLGAWVEEYHPVTEVTWEVMRGRCSISNQTLLNNVLSALIEVNQASDCMIKIKAKTGHETFVCYLELIVKDPSAAFISDYGMAA